MLLYLTSYVALSKVRPMFEQDVEYVCIALAGNNNLVFRVPIVRGVQSMCILGVLK